MLKMALGDLLGDPLSGQEGRKDTKIGSIRSKGSPALERGRFKCTEQCLALQGTTVSMKGLKSMSKGMRNLSVYVGW